MLLLPGFSSASVTTAPVCFTLLLPRMVVAGSSPPLGWWQAQVPLTAVALFFAERNWLLGSQGCYGLHVKATPVWVSITATPFTSHRRRRRRVKPSATMGLIPFSSHPPACAWPPWLRSSIAAATLLPSSSFIGCASTMPLSLSVARFRISWWWAERARLFEVKRRGERRGVEMGSRFGGRANGRKKSPLLFILYFFPLFY